MSKKYFKTITACDHIGGEEETYWESTLEGEDYRLKLRTEKSWKYTIDLAFIQKK